MMHTIYKEVLEVTDQQNIMLPKGAEVLTVQVQRSVPCIWYKFPKQFSNEKEPWSFQTFGTGHDVPATDIGQYVGTYQIRDGSLIFHVFGKKV